MLFFEMVFLCGLCASAYSALREVFFSWQSVLFCMRAIAVVSLLAMKTNA